MSKLCDICPEKKKRTPIGRCTQDSAWLVCSECFRPAAANGFYPRNFETGQIMTPQEAVIGQAVEEEKPALCWHDGTEIKVGSLVHV